MKRIDFLLSSNKNAYSDLERLVDTTQKDYKNHLILISLGPAGTVLASRLFSVGCQAIDIGHVTASYENAILNAPAPEQLK